jgi:hypothetical protein
MEVPLDLFARMLMEDVGAAKTFAGEAGESGETRETAKCPPKARKVIRQILEAGLDDPGAFYECFGFDVWCDELAMDKAWEITVFETDDPVLPEHRAAVHDFFFYELVEEMEENLDTVHSQLSEAMADVGRKLAVEFGRRSDASAKVQRAWRERSNSSYTAVGRRTILRRFPGL